IITWSMRSRGSVQRTHIITNTPPHPFRMKTSALIRLPKIGPKNVSLSSTGKRPVFQPPRNMVTAMPDTANMLPYSAMKKSSQRNPEYSVWKPATSSLSASSRSNGARLQLDVAQMKKTQKATKVNGSWKMYQFQKKPVCWFTTEFKFKVP